MSWRISPDVDEILARGADAEGIDRQQALTLMALELHTKETYALMETAHRLSRKHFGDKGENHFHIGVNAAPCPLNCRFCSLSQQAGIFDTAVDFSDAQILDWAESAQAQGADALNLMTTGNYSFNRFLKIGRMLKQAVDVPLVANTRDLTYKEAEDLVEAGFVGAYHALRLGEGRDTPLQPEKRIQTIRIIKEVGLRWMNCIEPVGPEHSHAEIVDLMFLARRYEATYSGIMRRINFPGSPMTRYGMINELEMAKMVAISRLVMGAAARAHCTHEPHSASLLAGANLFFPEVGASPRDGKADTGKGRGHSVRRCHAIQQEMAWRPDLPSNCFD